MKTQRILIAPDKFKGSLTSAEVADSIESGIQSVSKNVRITKIPLADGGDGFTEVATLALGGKMMKAENIPDALGRKRSVQYGWVEKSRTAILDVAGICGIAALKDSERNPMKASSLGLGILTKRLEKRNAREILLGLGGSATNDGGMGFAAGLGYQFKDVQGRILKPCGANLEWISKIEKPKKFGIKKIFAATDVTNPLLGKKGATHIFSQQKGATKKTLPILEKGMRNLASIAGKHKAAIAGAGAAGGLGYGVMTFADGELKNGFALIAKLTKLEQEIRRAHIVITGEGCIDAQTDGGKVPEGVRQLCVKYHKPIVAFAGMIKGGCGKYTKTFALSDIARSREESMKHAARLLGKLSAREFKNLLKQK